MLNKEKQAILRQILKDMETKLGLSSAILATIRGLVIDWLGHR